MDIKKECIQYIKHKQNISSLSLDTYISNLENMTSTVIEERNKNFREIDVFSRLIMERIIFLGTSVNNQMANIITAQLLFLESVNPKKDITLYINSPGGNVYAGLGIYDTIQYIEPSIQTVCIGLAASMGAVLLAGGEKNKRSALPHARILIHQPLGGAQGQASDMEITIKQMLAIKKDLYAILAKHTHKSIKQIEQDSDRDYWMNAKEAKHYGIIDEILERKIDKKAKATRD